MRHSVMVRTGVAVAFGSATLVAVTGGSASADPVPNDHDCAGVVVSSLAAPGFGQVVADAAHQQQVDNLGLADCGAPPRRNA